jgi:acyl dehydratase
MTIAELAELSGKIEHTYQVNPEVYHAFQSCSGDFNPLHTDVAFAQSKGFANCVMYGNILNAFISHFVGMLLPTSEVMIQSQDISFHKPVFLNDQISLEATVDTVSEAVGIIEYKLKFRRISDGVKPELVAKGHVQIGLLK